MLMHWKTALVGAVLAAAAASGPTVPQDANTLPASCEEQSQLALNMCAQRNFEAADAELNAMWPRVVADMRRRDQENTRAPVAGEQSYYETLLRAQRAWLGWRDAHCEVVGDQARGGSMQPMVWAQCRERLTRDRLTHFTMLLEERF
jgi:uncharacterized protein YecT (DUF1311 family)